MLESMSGWLRKGVQQLKKLQPSTNSFCPEFPPSVLMELCLRVLGQLAVGCPQCGNPRTAIGKLWGFNSAMHSAGSPHGDRTGRQPPLSDPTLVLPDPCLTPGPNVTDLADSAATTFLTLWLHEAHGRVGAGVPDRVVKDTFHS